MYIRRIILKNFWHNYDIEWTINKNVAILTGSNGSGKSTMLSIISSVLTEGRLSEELSHKVFKTIIELDDGITLTNINFRDSYKTLVKESATDSDLKALVDDVNSDMGNNTNKLKRVRIDASYTQALNNGNTVPLPIVLSHITVETIKTFDTPLPSEEFSSRKKSLLDKGVKTNLDLQLYLLQESYAYYLANLARNVEKKVANEEGNELTADYIKSLYERKNLFINIINEFFAETGKFVDTDNSVLSFILKKENRKLGVYDLSSGEKQVIYILLTALLNEGKHPIILMDEPEMSLHIDWQEILLESIIKINPECQLIIVTHSPSMLIRGWAPCVTHLDEILRRREDGGTIDK